MILDVQDYLLIFAIVICLILFYFEIRILTRQRMKMQTFTNIKFLAIFGILFFATATILGSTVAGYMTNEVIEENVEALSTGVELSTQNIDDLGITVTEIKRSVLETPPSSERDELLAHIEYLENKLRNQMNTNDDLEDDIEDIEDELEDLYALLPSGNY